MSEASVLEQSECPTKRRTEVPDVENANITTEIEGYIGECLGVLQVHLQRDINIFHFTLNFSDNVIAFSRFRTVIPDFIPFLRYHN